MSSAHGSHGHPVDPASNNEDGVNMKSIVTVGVVSLVIFALSAVVAALILRSDRARLREENGGAPVPTMVGKDEIGIVDQVEFESDRRLEQWRDAKRKRLASYGWSDKSKRLIHIPIDKAIEEVISQAAANPPPAGNQP